MKYDVSKITNEYIVEDRGFPNSAQILQIPLDASQMTGTEDTLTLTSCRENYPCVSISESVFREL